MAQHAIKVTFTPKPFSQNLRLNKIKYPMEDGDGFLVYENAEFEIADSLQVSFHGVASSGTKCTFSVEIDGNAQNYKGTFDHDGFADVSDFVDVPIDKPKDKTIPYPADDGGKVA